MKEYIVPVGDKGNMNMIENELHLQQLVRCKDCKYAPGNKEGYTCKIRDILGMYMKNPDYFFCADGESR